MISNTPLNEAELELPTALTRTQTHISSSRSLSHAQSSPSPAVPLEVASMPFDDDEFELPTALAVSKEFEFKVKTMADHDFESYTNICDIIRQNYESIHGTAINQRDMARRLAHSNRLRKTKGPKAWENLSLLLDELKFF